MIENCTALQLLPCCLRKKRHCNMACRGRGSAFAGFCCPGIALSMGINHLNFTEVFIIKLSISHYASYYWNSVFTTQNLLLISWIYLFVIGHFSWRHVVQGSWFIRALSDELGKSLSSTDDVDFARVLTRVTQTVAYNFQSHTAAVNLSARKQVPSLYSTLTKEIHFPNTAQAWHCDWWKVINIPCV